MPKIKQVALGQKLLKTVRWYVANVNAEEQLKPHPRLLSPDELIEEALRQFWLTHRRDKNCDAEALKMMYGPHYD